MVYFPNIENNWNAIAHRSVECLDDSNEFSSFKGRGISLLHTLATPLKALSGLGKLAISIIGVAVIILAVLTLNAHPDRLDQAAANLIDVTIGGAMLPIALLAHMARGIFGTIFHPAAMIKHSDLFTWGAKHNILQGTLVNY